MNRRIVALSVLFLLTVLTSSARVFGVPSVVREPCLDAIVAYIETDYDFLKLSYGKGRVAVAVCGEPLAGAGWFLLEPYDQTLIGAALDEVKQGYSERIGRINWHKEFVYYQCDSLSDQILYADRINDSIFVASVMWYKRDLLPTDVVYMSIFNTYVGYVLTVDSNCVVRRLVSTGL